MIDSLPIFSTVFNAYLRVLGNSGALLRALLIPAALLVSIEIARELAGPSTLGSFVAWLFSVPPAALLAIACHRVVLLGPGSLESRWSTYWSERETSYAVWLLVFGVFVFVAGAGLSIVFLMAPERVFGYPVPWLGEVLAFLSVLYLSGRFSMVLPATGVGKQMYMSQSWYLTAGNGHRILVVLLIPLLVGHYGLLLLERLLLGVSEIAFGLTAVALMALSVAVETAVLSLSYEWLRKDALATEDV